MQIIRIPSRISTRLMSRAEMRAIADSLARPLDYDEIVFLGSIPPIEPPTDLELRKMAAEYRDRQEGRIRQRSEAHFPVNPHD